MRLRWSLISTGVPGRPRGVQPAAAVGQHDGRAARRGGGADAVHDRADALALVEVGAGAVDERAPAGVGDRAPSASCRCARRPRPWRTRARRRCRWSVRVSPIRSPVWPQPEPRTRATSCRSTPVRSAITAAAAVATSNGSVAGSARSGTPGTGCSARHARGYDGARQRARNREASAGDGPGRSAQTPRGRSPVGRSDPGAGRTADGAGRHLDEGLAAVGDGPRPTRPCAPRKLTLVDRVGAPPGRPRRRGARDGPAP